MFPERHYQNGFPIFLEILYRVSQNTAVQKHVSSAFFCIVIKSLFLKEKNWGSEFLSNEIKLQNRVT